MLCLPENQLILLKLGVVVEPTNGTNRLCFGGDPIKDADSRLLFHFSQGWRGGLVVGRRTCDLVVAGSRPGRDAAA